MKTDALYLSNVEARNSPRQDGRIRLSGHDLILLVMPHSKASERIAKKHLSELRHESESVCFEFSDVETLRALEKKPSLRKLAPLYLSGKLSIHGDIIAAAHLLNEFNVLTDSRGTLLEALIWQIFRIKKAIVPAWLDTFDSKDHYSVPSKAYSAFLDPMMQYTCGYFPAGYETLEEAQIAKFNLIRTWSGMDLAGKRHLDIGCGWGGQINYFRNNFKTNSFGLTNTQAQLDFIKDTSDVPVIFGDFSVAGSNPDMKFDLITIVGMMEHLTPKRQSELLRMANRILNPGGRIYLQAVGKPDCFKAGDLYRLTQRFVFPGFDLAFPEEVLMRARNAGLKLVSDFKRDDAQHYGKTTAHWVRNLERNKSQFIEAVDEDIRQSLLNDNRAKAKKDPFGNVMDGNWNYRLFHAYLALSSAAFESGRGRLMRFMFEKV